MYLYFILTMDLFYLNMNPCETELPSQKDMLLYLQNRISVLDFQMSKNISQVFINLNLLLL